MDRTWIKYVNTLVIMLVKMPIKNMSDGAIHKFMPEPIDWVRNGSYRSGTVFYKRVNANEVH